MAFLTGKDFEPDEKQKLLFNTTENRIKTSTYLMVGFFI